MKILLPGLLLIFGFASGVYFGPVKTVYHESTTFQCPDPLDDSTVFHNGAYTGNREWKL